MSSKTSDTIPSGFRNLRATKPLSDIFISYSRSDRATAQTLANALQRENWSVWWDPKIPPGKAFDVSGTDVWDVDQDGRAVSIHAYWDVATLMNQLGLL